MRQLVDFDFQPVVYRCILKVKRKSEIAGNFVSCEVLSAVKTKIRVLG